MSLKPQPPRPMPPEMAAWGVKHLVDDDPYKHIGDMRCLITLPLRWSRCDFYAYDGLQRLVGANESPGTTSASAYDLAGNRIDGGKTYNAANQITNAGYTYDEVGNLTGDGSATYAYDDDDALRSSRVRQPHLYYDDHDALPSSRSSRANTRFAPTLRWSRCATLLSVINF